MSHSDDPPAIPTQAPEVTSLASFLECTDTEGAVHSTHSFGPFDEILALLEEMPQSLQQSAKEEMSRSLARHMIETYHNHNQTISNADKDLLELAEEFCRHISLSSRILANLQLERSALAQTIYEANEELGNLSTTLDQCMKYKFGGEVLETLRKASAMEETRHEEAEKRLDDIAQEEWKIEENRQAIEDQSKQLDEARDQGKENGDGVLEIIKSLLALARAE